MVVVVAVVVVVVVAVAVVVAVVVVVVVVVVTVVAIVVVVVVAVACNCMDNYVAKLKPSRAENMAMKLFLSLPRVDHRGCLEVASRPMPHKNLVTPCPVSRGVKSRGFVDLCHRPPKRIAA